MNYDWYATSVDELSKCNSYEQLRFVASRILGQLGLPIWVVAIQIPSSLHAPETYGVNNFDDAWWQEYVENDWIKHDPLPKYAINNHRPRFWTLSGWADEPGHRWENDDPESVGFFKQVERFGARSGLIIPYHLGDNTRTLLNLPHPESIENSRYFLMAARIWAFSLLPDLVGKIQDIYISMGIVENPKLTKREKDVLFLIGEGFTSKAISEQLHISCRTVESYLLQIQRKLRASNRQQTIAKAVSLGLLRPAARLGGLTYSVSAAKEIQHNRVSGS